MVARQPDCPSTKESSGVIIKRLEPRILSSIKPDMQPNQKMPRKEWKLLNRAEVESDGDVNNHLNANRVLLT